MDLCINIESLRNQLIKDINSSNLTIGAAMLVVKDVYNIIYLSYLDQMEKEKSGKNIQVVEEDIDFPVAEEIVKEVTENGEQNND